MLPLNGCARVVSQDWFDRYAIPFERYRLPKNKSEQAELALTIGTDGEYLLSKLYELETSSALSQLTSVEILRQVWLQQYTWVDGSMVWRSPSTTGLPACKQMIASPLRPQCTRAKQEPRLLKFRLREEHESLQLARQRQETTEFKEKYAQRAGIEGTISQGTRAFNLRRSRYLGLAKTHWQHIATAAAINLIDNYSSMNGKQDYSIYNIYGSRFLSKHIVTSLGLL